MTVVRRPGVAPRLVLVAMAFLVATIGVGSQVALVTDLTPDASSAVYPHPTQKPEVLLNAHDGQFFAAIAEDPLLRHPQTIGPEAAQRASRPLFGWLAAIGSLGRHHWIPWTLMALTALSIAALVAAVIALADALGRDGSRWTVLAVIGTPGVIALIAFPGLSDALGAALAIGGLAAWKRDRHDAALALFMAAGLSHEALLVFPGAVFLAALVRRSRRAWRWLTAVVPYGLWVVFVRLRVGEWPTASSHGNLGLPFDGFLSAVHDRWQLFDGLCFGVLVLAGVVTWVRLPQLALRALVAGFAVIAVLLGPYIWARWVDFGRVLLPLAALAIVAVAPEVSRPATTPRTNLPPAA